MGSARTSGKQSQAKAAAASAVQKNEVDKYIRYPDEICANDFVNPNHDALYRDSIEN